VIPSELEINVMKVLWQKQEATGSAIYAQIDSAQLTAVDLKHVLDAMTERGLLERRQISPRHEFTILGTFAIEESSLNRKNREYLYRPQVTRHRSRRHGICPASRLAHQSFGHRRPSAQADEPAGGGGTIK
jgi:predicted transcriptional regulator